MTTTLTPKTQTQTQPQAVPAAPSSPIKILYIASEARSGSTLLGRLLAEVDGCVHVGEIDRIWLRFFKEENLCECGLPFRECPFWQAVFQKGFGGFDGVDLEALFAVKDEFERFRTIPNLLWARKTAAQAKALDDYAQALRTLYGAIREVTDARVIVDGSKAAPYAYMLGRVPGLDLRLLHLVRDSRAVAYSHQNKKPNPAVQTEANYLETVSPTRVSATWSGTNIVLQARHPSAHYLFLRYEDLIGDPEGAITRLWSLMDEPVPDFNFLRQSPMYLRQSHTVAGNPDRFNPEVKIRPDTKWRREMEPKQRKLVTTLTLPLLLQYGYLKGK